MQFEAPKRQILGWVLLGLFIAIFIIVRSWHAIHWNQR